MSGHTPNLVNGGSSDLNTSTSVATSSPVVPSSLASTPSAIMDQDLKHSQPPPPPPAVIQPSTSTTTASTSTSITSTGKSKKDSRGSGSGSSSKKSAPGKNSDSKDKKKLVVACIACRKKKIKCSSDRPACSNCLRLNILCEYPVIRNRGSRFGYMEMLNKRLNHLEKYINCSTNPDYHPQFVKIHQKPRPSADFEPVATSHSTNSTNSTNVTNINKDHNPIRGTSPPTDPDLTMQNTIANTSLEPDTDSLITQLGPGISKQLTPPSITPKQNSSMDSIELPPLDIILHLVELYFRHVHGQTYSFLHKPTLIPRIYKNQVNKAIILALCGLTARFSRHPAITTRVPYLAGEEFVSRARKVISMEFDDPNLETVQAMILLVQHDFFRSKGKKSMIYISMALRMAATLGLHEESPDPKLTFLEREQRRRTYWSLVVLDRLGHSGPHWHVQLRADIVDIQMPCTDYCYDNCIPVNTQKLNGDPPPPIKLSGNAQYPVYPTAKLGLYAYIVKITILWCDINKYVMEGYKQETIPPWKEGSKYQELEARLQALFAELPKDYQYSRERLIALDTVNQGGALVHLHGELLMSLCYLNRVVYPYNYKKMKFDESPPASFVERAAINIMASAKAQSSMIEDVLMMEDFNMAPFIGFGVFAVSSVHIANSFSSDPAVASAAKNNLAINLKFLVIMREYWYSVGVWCIILKDRYFQKARRHKLRMQQQQYSEGSAADSKKNVEAPTQQDKTEKKEKEDDDDDETSQIFPDGFSRPGTPPLAYAPDGMMYVAANKSGHSETSSGVSSPGVLSTYDSSSRASSSGDGATAEAVSKQSLQEAVGRVVAPNPPQQPQQPQQQQKQQLQQLQPQQQQPAPLPLVAQPSNENIQSSFARTWARAVPQAYTGDIDENLTKRIKLEHEVYPKGSTEIGSSGDQQQQQQPQPASPSQFADILTMPALGQSANRYYNNKHPKKPEEGGSDAVAPGENVPDSNGTTIIGVSSTSRNNLLTDMSGEWLNSLENFDFQQSAAVEKSVNETSPLMWFNNGIFGSLLNTFTNNNGTALNSESAPQQQQRLQQLLLQKFRTQMGNGDQQQENGQGTTGQDQTQPGSKQVRVLIDEEKPRDLSIVDESLFQQSLIHQPFTPISSSTSVASRSNNSSIISHHNQSPWIKSPLEMQQQQQSRRYYSGTRPASAAGEGLIHERLSQVEATPSPRTAEGDDTTHREGPPNNCVPPTSQPQFSRPISNTSSPAQGYVATPVETDQSQQQPAEKRGRQESAPMLAFDPRQLPGSLNEGGAPDVLGMSSQAAGQLPSQGGADQQSSHQQVGQQGYPPQGNLLDEIFQQVVMDSMQIPDEDQMDSPTSGSSPAL